MNLEMEVVGDGDDNDGSEVQQLGCIFFLLQLFCLCCLPLFYGSRGMRGGHLK